MRNRIVSLMSSFLLKQGTAKSQQLRQSFPLIASSLGCALLFFPLSTLQAAPVMGAVTASNLLRVDPFNAGITYGGTWGDDSSAGSPAYSKNYHWMGLGYAYDGTFDDPDCNAFGQWSPYTCPGISYDDTSMWVVPNGYAEWNSAVSITNTPGPFVSTFKARQTAMMRAKSQLSITGADHYMPRFSVTVPVTGAGIWKLDLKVTRNGIVERNGAGSDYIVVRPLNTTVTGGSLASGSLNLAGDALRSGNGSWNVVQSSTASVTGSGAANVAFDITYEVDSKVTGSGWAWDPARQVCWRAGQGNGANGGGISCNPAITPDQGVFLEGTFTFLDHLRYEFDPNAAATCSPLPVTVKACSDSAASCATLYSGGVTFTPTATAGSGSFNWSSSPLGVPVSGSVAASISGNTSGVPVTLGAAGGIGVQCFDLGGASIPCSIPSFSQCDLVVRDGYNKPWMPAKPVAMYTKLAGVTFPNGGVTVTAIKGGSKMTGYTGAPTIELVNANTGTTCANRTVLATISTAAYVLGDSGEKLFAITYNDAVANAQIRAKDLPSGIQPSCSDSFTIRPASLVTSSDILAALNVTRKAGLDTFTLTSTAKNGAGVPATTTAYTGSPKVDVGGGKLQGVRADLATNTVATGTLSSTVFGAAAAGVASLPNVTYSEVGYFNLKDGAVYDNDFTSASGDIAAGDCTSDYSNAAVNGKYGCYFKASAVTSHGRFYPDHFNLTRILGCTVSNFTYSGQPFASLSLTAVNNAGATTQNYNTTDGFSKAATLSITDPLAPGGSLNSTSIAANSFNNGTSSNATTTFTFTSADTAPTTLTLHAVESAGGDGVASVGASDPTANIWSGRVRMLPASGASNLDLPMTMQLERYEGIATQWQPNANDACTSITLNPLTYVTLPANTTCVLDTGSPGTSAQGCAAPATVTRRYHNQPGALATPSANFNLWLSAPGLGNVGTVRVTPIAPAWLGTLDAMATFGTVGGANGATQGSPILYRRAQ